MIYNSFQCFLPLYFHTSTEVYQTKIVAFFVHMALCKCKRAYRHGCFLKCRILKLNQGFKSCLTVQILTELLIALNKHPDIRRKESATSFQLCHLGSPYNKCREEITLIISIRLDPQILFNILRSHQLRQKTARTTFYRRGKCLFSVKIIKGIHERDPRLAGFLPSADVQILIGMDCEVIKGAHNILSLSLLM